jgi:hypothetical protein
MGIAVTDPMTYEFLFLENRVQSANLSAAPPYVPQMLLTHWTNLKPLSLAESAITGETRFPGEPPFFWTAQAMIPKTVATMPTNAGHINFSSL